MSINNKNRGFTIVELLIVIVVIGILAAITIVAFNGIQQRARNTMRVNEVKQYQTLLMSYKATYGEYPSAGTMYSCLGESFPDVTGNGVGNCWDLHSATSQNSESPALITELKKVAASLPGSSKTPVPGDGTSRRLGPAYISGSTSGIVYWIEGTGSCPVGVLRWSDSSSRACQISLP